MAKPPKAKSDWKADAVKVASKFGPDGTLYIVVAAGAFLALSRKADPIWVFATSFLFVGGWIANKFATAYLSKQEAKQRLDATKQKIGQKLLVTHKDRQGQLELNPNDEQQQGDPNG